MHGFRTASWLLLFVVAGGLVSCLLYQRVQLSRLSARETQLTEEVNTLRQTAPAEKAASPPDQSSGAGLDQQLELLRLRNEVTQLKSQQRDLEKLQKENKLLTTKTRLLQNQLAARPEPGLPQPEPPFNAWVGVQITAQPGIDAAEPGRVIISGVMENSPAAQAQLQDGDVVLSVNGDSITNMLQLRTIIGSSVVGVPLVFDLLRDNNSMQVTVVPNAPPPQFQRANR